MLPAARDALRYPPGFFQQLARRYGDVAGLRAGPARVVLLSDPELARDLLVTSDHLFERGGGVRRVFRRLLGEGVLGSEGDFHDGQHALVWPTVHGSALEPYARIVGARGERLQESWREGDVVDVADFLAEATQQIMVEGLSGASVDTPAGRELRDALAEAVDALESLPFPFLPVAEQLPVPANRRFDRARARLDSLILEAVDQRRGAGEESPDLLGALARAKRSDGQVMEARQVRDEALSLFRGHKTTSTALSWTWYLLARHPEVEARVSEEINAVVGDRVPVAADLGDLPYSRMVLDESMRLFPPAWALSRRARVDYEVGGYVVPAGSTVFTSAYVIHRDARFHPHPLRFDPDRFTPERRAGWHPFAYFPFGGGPKKCLGDEFAPFEAVLLMASIGRRWRLRLAPGHRVEPAPQATLKLRYGLKMVLERRA